ncbi:MAG: DUF2087 domain-containing protein [Rubrivivax sp.]|jgi:hypothetical protein|nr:DUF2087 domain-containing protein [Rubrivivax sp.]
MPRVELPLLVPDLSGFARALGRALKSRDTPTPPTHSEVLNLIAQALGQRNHQALRAALLRAPPAVLQPASKSEATEPEPEPAPTLSVNARKALAQFDDSGALLRWPVKFSVQKLAMWILWTRFEAKRPYTEREVNAILKAANRFDDHATLRRELVNHRLLERKSDCSEYRKLAARPDDETRLLLAAARARFRGG